MTKKSTHWVTIPEEKIHTPASKASKKGAKMSGKSKLFWGAGFVVVVIVTVALMAPQQMANLLQGNLFEQSGIQPLEVIPTQNEDEEISVTEEEEPEPVESEDDIAVEAETEAVSIQIDPVPSAAEESDEFDVSYLIDCTEWEGDYSMGSIEFEIKLTELDSESCNVYYLNTKNINSDFEGTEMDCTVPKGEYTDEEYIDYMNENQLDTCSGSYVDLVNSLTEGNSDAAEAAEGDEIDANRKLLEELSNQIAEFKEKDEEKTAIIEDLADMVKEQMDTEIRPSATETVPSAVSATTAIGQPGYRVNTHTVAVTPHQVLQQGNEQLQMQQYVSADLTADEYSTQLAAAQGTPDSGPKEVLLFSLILSFLALLGWKVGKLARV